MRHLFFLFTFAVLILFTEADEVTHEYLNGLFTSVVMIMTDSQEKRSWFGEGK